MINLLFPQESNTESPLTTKTVSTHKLTRNLHSKSKKTQNVDQNELKNAVTKITEENILSHLMPAFNDFMQNFVKDKVSFATSDNHKMMKKFLLQRKVSKTELPTKVQSKSNIGVFETSR